MPRQAEAWVRARSPRSRRCSPASQGFPARFSAALRTPMDRATASQTATDRLAKNSGSHSRGFALQSRGATGTTSCAPDPNERSEAMTMLDATAAPLGADARAFVLLKSRRRLDLLNPDPQA